MKQKKLKMPNALVILFILLIFMAALTYFIPAGQYTRIEGPNGRQMVDPTSFTFIDSKPTSLLGFLSSIPKGFVESASVIAFTLIIAGAFEVIQRTGLLRIMVKKLSTKFSKKSEALIPVLMMVFGFIAAFVGTAELSMVYVPIILPLIISLGFNNIVAVAVPLVATVVGFTAAFTNPFTVGISHQITGLPMFSGMWLRVIVFVIFMIISCIYVIRYAKSIKVDSHTSLQNAMRLGIIEQDMELGSSDEEFTTRHKIIGIVFVLVFAYMVYGVLKKGWGMIEMAGVFVGLGIIAGIIGKMNSDEIVSAFVEGCKSVLAGGILIGVARGVSVIMNDAMIIDTIVYFFAKFLQALPSFLNAIGILIIQTIFNFFVPSGSGKALVTMPIISPLADIVGVNQQVAVLAFQFGDGLTNVFVPTSGYFMATLAIGKVEYTDWVKFYFKLLALLFVLSMIFLVVAQAINYGPF